MDAIAGEIEPDPDGADGVVGAGRDDEFFGNPFALRRAAEDGGVEGVVRVVDANFDAQLAAGAFVDAARDADGAVKKEAVLGAEDAECALRERDLNVGGRLLDAEWRDVRDANAIARRELIPVDAGIEAGD